MSGVVRYVALLALVGVTGCASLPRFAPDGVVVGVERAAERCEALHSRLPPLHGFRALLDTSVKARDETYFFRYAIVARDPHDLRIDLLPSEGSYTLGLLTVRDNESVMIDAQQKRYMAGCESDQLFQKFFGLEGISSDVVKALIVGRVPRTACQGTQMYQQQSGYTQILDTVAHRVWEVDEATGALVGVRILNATHDRVYASARREKAPQGDAITISVFKPVTASADMQIKKLTLNPVISEGLFDVRPPAGYERDACD
jgi:hypothetical protein